ncbi:MAG: PfkB family carbohydrate kinase [Pseudomonadota bacterium]
MNDEPLATVGDNCIDRYLHLNKSAVGGNAVNVAVHLSQLNWNCAYFGAVGDDSDGRRTRDVLRANKVDLGPLRTLPGITSFTNLDIDETGDRIITQEDFGVCADYWPSDEDIARLAAKRHIHIGWFQHSSRLRARLAGAAVTVSQDVAVNPDDGGLDIAFGSVGPSMTAARDRIDALLRAGNKIAVVTCGPLGSVASDGGGLLNTGIKPVDVVDTTGAGDTFIAGFLDAWLRAEPLQDCLDAGRDNAAKTCTHLGGFAQDYESLGLA